MGEAEGIGKAELELRKYEARMGLWKIIFGTVIVGLAGVLIPGAIEYWSLSFQERRAELEIITEREKNGVVAERRPKA